MESQSATSNYNIVANATINYNSEWNKLCLLLWKNLRVTWTLYNNLILSVVTPVLFCIVLIILRLEYPDLQVHPTSIYNSVNLTKGWHDLVHILDERRSLLDRKFPGNAIQSPFIPQQVIGYAPNEKAYRTMMNKSKKKFTPMTVSSFKSCTDLKNAIITSALFCGICFSEEDTLRINPEHNNNNIGAFNSTYPAYLIYTMMFPAYLRIYNDTYISNNWQTLTLFPVRSVNVQNAVMDDGNVGYIREGFAYVQNVIAMTYIEELIAEKQMRLQIPQLVLNRFPEKKRLQDYVLQNIDFCMSLMIVLSNIYPIISTAAMIVQEKEEKSKIFTQIAGIDNYLHVLSWLIKAFIQSLLSSVFTVILLKIHWSTGLAIFNKCSFIAWLSVICLYNITSICFCLMVTAFCSNTTLVITCTTLLWFLTYLPYWASVMMYEPNLSAFNFTMAILFHNTLIGYLMQTVMAFEQRAPNHSFLEFLSMTDLEGKHTIFEQMIILLAQGTVYMAIGLYAEELLPGTYGTSKRWNFFFQRKSTSMVEKDKEYKYYTEYAVTTSRTESFIHEIASTNAILVEVKGVTKKFGEETVVSNFNLQLRENEITILTGHNSSGKSIIITMICGLIPPTSGTIQIEGFSVLKDQKYACASLGVCMQQSTLYEDLTVEDQLRFFSFLRGMNPKVVEQEVQKYLLATNLMSKRSFVTRNLNRGLRQELGVCCALTGRSRIVILDEPNSAMDAAERKRIWDLLVKEKRGRTILIATNYSECFSFLGDRVAIIANGELQCVGSPAFLRKMYGQGYRLVCTKMRECDIDAVSQFLGKYVPHINPVSKLGNELVYIIDEKFADIMEDIGKDLEENLNQLRLVSYSLQQLSLRDIHIKMGTYFPPHENRTRLIEALNGLSIYSEDNDHIKFLEIKERVRGMKRFWQHFWAYGKTLFILKRYHKFYMCSKFLLPPLFTWFAFLVSTYSLRHTPLTSIEYSLEQYERTITTVHIKNNISEDMKKISESYSEGVFWLGTQHTLDDTKHRRFEEYIVEKSRRVRLETHSFVGISFLPDRVVCWFNNYALHSIPLALNLFHNAMQKVVIGEKSRIRALLEPIDTGTIYTDGHLLNALSTGVVLAVFITLAFSFVSNGIVFITIRERECGFRSMQESSGLQLWIYYVVVCLYDVITLIIVTSLVVITILLKQMMTNHTPASTSYAVYFFIILLGAYCIHSFNYMLAELFKNEVHGVVCSLTISVISILSFCHYAQGFNIDYIISPTKIVSPYLLLIPHLVMCSAIMTTYYITEINILCGNHDIQFTSINLENCNVQPNCCVNYHYMNFYGGILNELILLILYTALCWTVALGKRTKIFWKLHKVPKDNLASQLIDHQRRHDNDDSRFHEHEAYLESIKIVQLSGPELKEAPLVCHRAGKLYGRKAGLDRFNLILKRGEVVSVIGETGCGKSSLCKVITTNENLSYGRTFVMGISSLRDRKAVVRLVGYSQQYNLRLPEFTIQNLLTYLCQLHDYPRKHINAICINLTKILGIYSEYQKPLSIISHGTFKILLCAITLLGNRPLLVLDSLSISIDQVSRHMLWRVLLKLQSLGTAILFTNNSFEDTFKYCDRMCVMSYGRCHYLGPTTKFDMLYNNYRLLKVKFYHKIHEAKNNLNNKYIYVSCLNKLQRFMKIEFPTAIFKYELGNFLIFLIPMETNKVWHIFSRIQRNAYFLNIEYFELSQTLQVSFEDFVQLQDPIYR